MESAHRLQPWPKGRPPLDTAQAASELGTLAPAWRVLDGARLERSFATRDFGGSLALAQRIGALAEVADHHPELRVRWGELTVALWTHSAGGLTPLDFQLARWIDALVPSLESPSGPS